MLTRTSTRFLRLQLAWFAPLQKLQLVNQKISAKDACDILQYVEGTSGILSSLAINVGKKTLPKIGRLHGTADTPATPTPVEKLIFSVRLSVRSQSGESIYLPFLLRAAGTMTPDLCGYDSSLAYSVTR